MGFFSVVPDNVRACAASSTSSSQVGHAIRLRTQSPYPTPFSSQLNSEFHEQQHHEIAPNISFYISLVFVPTSHTMYVRQSMKHTLYLSPGLSRLYRD